MAGTDEWLPLSAPFNMDTPWDVAPVVENYQSSSSQDGITTYLFKDKDGSTVEFRMDSQRITQIIMSGPLEIPQMDGSSVQGEMRVSYEIHPITVEEAENVIQQHAQALKGA